MQVEFYKHALTDQDRKNVDNVLRSLFLTTGSVTATFEEKFAKWTGVPYVVGVTSCTAALHLSLLSFGIGPGDEVITTPMTFIATATAIMHTGATPVFVDVEEETGLLNVAKVEEAITERTKAIIPVHLYGTMVDMKALRRMADRNQLVIIEDCAHCIEGERDGIRPGDLGDSACYSFYATKNLTCGEGGAVATRHPEIAEKIKILRLHGMSKDAVSRYQGAYKHWDMVQLGWKYNMSDIQAALLVDQLDRLAEMQKERKRIFTLYSDVFQNLPGTILPTIYGKSAHHLYTIWIKDKERDKVLEELENAGVGVAVNYRAIHTLSYFRETFSIIPSDYSIANRIGNQTLSLPLYPGLSDQDVCYVAESVNTALRTI